MTPRRRPKQPGRPRDPADLIYPTLDLHGFTAAEAEASARRWLAAQRDAGEATVRLITGRGLHSAGPAVLPTLIEDLLTELHGAEVRGWEREPGGGVYRVQLTRAIRPRSRTDPVPRRDPALVREAEEALGELGITPTPALIEAEVRRILAERGRQR